MATTKGTTRGAVRTGARTTTTGSQLVDAGKPTTAVTRGTPRRARAGRKIQKKMPVIWEDGSVRRPSARGSKALQPPPANGPITSRLPLSRGTDGLATVATTAIGEFWDKFHHYHRLQAELEKLYLWFEDFEQALSRDNEELGRVLAGAQAIYGHSGEAPGKPAPKRSSRAQAAANGSPKSGSVRSQAGRRQVAARSR